MKLLGRAINNKSNYSDNDQYNDPKFRRVLKRIQRRREKAWKKET